MLFLICETFKISCLMRKLHTREVLENLLKDRSFRFGSLVEYYPISAKDQSRIHQFGKKVLPGLFLGYSLYAGGIWKGDLTVADIEELETMDASEIYCKRLNAQEVIFPQKMENSFSSRRWTNQIFWRRSGTENIHLDTGTPNSRRRSRRFSWWIKRVSSTTSRLTSEAINDFWSMSGNFIYGHHVEPRVKLYSERRIIPYSTEIHWCVQNCRNKFGW